MKKILPYLLYGTLASCSPSASPEPKDASVTEASLIGRWEHIEYQGHGGGKYYEFASDKTVRVIDPADPNVPSVYPYVIEGNILRIQRQSHPPFLIIQPKEECETWILPGISSTRLTIKDLGPNYCIYAYKGSETFEDFTLVKE